MFHRHLSATLILIVSIIIGIMSVLQFLSLQKNKMEFQEKNPFREIRTMIKNNQEQKNQIANIEQRLNSINSEIERNTEAQRKISEANLLSGIEPQQSCEGCEHTNKYHNGISANGVCLKCKDFSNYQPKEK